MIASERTQQNVSVGKAVVPGQSLREVCQLPNWDLYLLHLLGVVLKNTVARMKPSDFSHLLFIDFKGDKR